VNGGDGGSGVDLGGTRGGGGGGGENTPRRGHQVLGWEKEGGGELKRLSFIRNLFRQSHFCYMFSFFRFSNSRRLNIKQK
jgi:hypothetical protein